MQTFKKMIDDKDYILSVSAGAPGYTCCSRVCLVQSAECGTTEALLSNLDSWSRSFRVLMPVGQALSGRKAHLAGKLAEAGVSDDGVLLVCSTVLQSYEMID